MEIKASTFFTKEQQLQIRDAIKEAEGRAQAILNVQTAVAKGIELVKAAKADKAVLTLEAYKAMENVSKGQATKIIIPSEMQGIVGLASGLAEALKDPEKPTK